MVSYIKCPICGSPTKLRISKKDGSKFHVCSRYPDCKGKVAFDDEWEYDRSDDRDDKSSLCNRYGSKSSDRQPHHRTSGLAIVSLILGIIGAGILAIIFGVLGMKDAKKPGVEGYGLAVAGLVLGILGAIASVFWIVFAVSTNQYTSTYPTPTYTHTAIQSGNCSGSCEWAWVGDGECDDLLGCNVAACNYDGGDCSVTVTQLADEYNANELAADAKYRYRTLQIYGEIEHIGKELFSETPYITFGAWPSSYPTKCDFLPTEESKIIYLSEGQYITVQGYCTGYNGGHVTFEDCILISEY